ncbi:MAG TPA: class I SAM-dependent methyltransferase [Gaiellaceae bacterium]|nr:class I SAM-dependent methyltransferase [Gaiellaceae bacterium]
MTLPEHADVNRAHWTRANVAYTDRDAEEKWAREEIVWGSFEWRESELGVLGDVAGLDVIELGCGTAYVSAWLARRGACPVGVDVTPAQLDTARRMQKLHGLDFPLVEASAEDVPLPDESFDLAISEFGASIWCDPARWVPEAARLLRPGGRLVFMRGSTLQELCFGAERVTERLEHDWEELARMDFSGEDGGVEFHAPVGVMLAHLRQAGFELLELRELLAPPDAEAHSHYDFVSAEWGRRWPSVEIWVARKTG